MKAPNEAQLRLLDLQEHDTALDRLTHRRRTLPEHEEVERLQGRLAELRTAIVTAETEASDLSREQTKAESDVDQVRTRAERDRARLDSGQLSSPKELETLQSEIASLERRQSELEDTVLEIMERREGAERRRDELTSDSSDIERQLGEVQQRRDTALHEIDEEMASVGEQRTAARKEIPEELLGLYDRLREQYTGVGAAELWRGRCQGCHLALNTVDLNHMRDAPEDEVLRCEECRRILVRTKNSGL